MSNHIQIIAQKAALHGFTLLSNPTGKLVLLMPFIKMHGTTSTAGHQLVNVESIDHLNSIIGY